jgi:hypothetical protein
MDHNNNKSLTCTLLLLSSLVYYYYYYCRRILRLRCLIVEFLTIMFSDHSHIYELVICSSVRSYEIVFNLGLQ